MHKERLGEELGTSHQTTPTCGCGQREAVFGVGEVVVDDGQQLPSGPGVRGQQEVCEEAVDEREEGFWRCGSGCDSGWVRVEGAMSSLKK